MAIDEKVNDPFLQWLVETKEQAQIQYEQMREVNRRLKTSQGATCYNYLEGVISTYNHVIEMYKANEGYNK